jgi:phosphoglycolate phosphatase-like HAD superfamily hydrolase
MSELVLFDIDGTLFNPEFFGKLIRQEFIKILSTSEEDLMSVIADYYANLEMTSDFDPREITSFTAKRYNADLRSLDRVFWENKQIYVNCLYPEVVDVLKKLSKDKTLGVFSQGNDELQRHKIKECGLETYLTPEYYYIFRRKDSDAALAELPRESTVIDDNHDVVLKIKPFVEAIWMNRRTNDRDPNVRTIHNLKELL